MNTKATFYPKGAFSLIDLLLLIGTMGLLAAVLVPVLTKPKMHVCRINCVNNLKQVGLSFRLWAGDNGDKFPMQVSTRSGGSMEQVTDGLVAPHFQLMSNELATPKILICPQQSKRVAATNFASLQETNLSYFVVPEADESLPQLWLTGDRNLATNRKALKPGLATVTPNTALGWTAEPHQHNGNLTLSDGSVQQFSNARLPAFLSATFTAYSGATSNTTFRILLP